MQKIKIYLYYITSSIFYFPAVFLHEMFHYFLALITGASISSVVLFPKIHIEEDRSYNITYGSVSFTPRIKVLGIIPALAPVLLWVVLYYFLDYNNIIRINFDMSILSIHMDIIKLLTVNNIWIIYVSWMLFWGAFPSRQDIKVALNYLFSISGFVFIVMLLVLGFMFYKGMFTHYMSL